MSRRKESPDGWDTVTIRLYRGDKDRLSEYYPRSGYNKAIRTLINRHLRHLDAKTNRSLSEDETTRETDRLELD